MNINFHIYVSSYIWGNNKCTYLKIFGTGWDGTYVNMFNTLNTIYIVNIITKRPNTHQDLCNCEAESVVAIVSLNKQGSKQLKTIFG